MPQPTSEAPPATGSGPVGTGNRVIRDGDCFLSIAFETGHFHEKLWNLPENAPVRDAREFPHKLLPGDRITVPPIEPGQVSKPCEQRHVFRRKGVPAKLKLKFLLEEPPEEEEAAPAPESGRDALHASSEDPDPPPQPEPKPRANVPYTLVVDGHHQDGQTNADGELEVFIPPGARTGILTLEPGTERETRIPLRLGSLDPLDEPTGIAQRLYNLGFPVDGDGRDPEPLARALQAFQERHGIELTGKADDATRSKIQELHGS